MTVASHKGSSFERQVAADLSLWLTKGRDKTQLIRSVMSGGWTHGRVEAEGWQQVGDLMPNGTEGAAFRRNWAVECKHYKVIDWWHEFTCGEKGSMISQWWSKSLLECKPHKLEPLLIMRQNHKPMMIGFRENRLHFAKVPGLVLTHLELEFIPFKTFLEVADPECFMA